MAPIIEDALEGPPPLSPHKDSILMPLQDRLKDVIQNLFEIQSNIQGYLGPRTQEGLVRNMYLLPHPLPSPPSPPYPYLLTALLPPADTN